MQLKNSAKAVFYFNSIKQATENTKEKATKQDSKKQADMKATKAQ